jgi:hypothetical protein
MAFLRASVRVAHCFYAKAGRESTLLPVVRRREVLANQCGFTVSFGI